MWSPEQGVYLATLRAVNDDGTSENSEEVEATYRLLNDEISVEAQRLLDESRSLDTKATLIAGFSAAAVSFLLTNRRETIWDVALVAYGATIALALATLWPWRWSHLGPQSMTEEFHDLAPSITLGEVVGTKVTVYHRNFRYLRVKTILWDLSVAAIAVSSALTLWTTLIEKARP